MNLDPVKQFTDRLQAETIGTPEWIKSKQSFEYQNQTIEVVVVLKIIRAVQGLQALTMLCKAGLFVDMGTIYRCVNDSVSEVIFLLEKYPEQSGCVQKFVREFFSKTIDGFLTTEEHSVQTSKIHSAVIRCFSDGKQNEDLKRMIDGMYKTSCGYTHAGYAHIMQMYGGNYPKLTFNLSGISSKEQVNLHMNLVNEAHKAVLYTIALSASKFGLEELYKDVAKIC